MKTSPFLWLYAKAAFGCLPIRNRNTHGSTSTPPGQMETVMAATIYADQTSTVAAKKAEEATLTAAVPTPTSTPEVRTGKPAFAAPSSARCRVWDMVEP